MRIGAIIAAFYYFVITVGISISFHFCKGELTCFSFLSENNLCCHAHNDHQDSPENSCEDSSQLCTDECCSTESINITLASDFTLKFEEVPNNVISSKGGEGFYDTLFIDSQTITENAPSRGSPEQRDLYLLHSSFIFYG